MTNASAASEISRLAGNPAVMELYEPVRPEALCPRLSPGLPFDRRRRISPIARVSGKRLCTWRKNATVLMSIAGVLRAVAAERFVEKAIDLAPRDVEPERRQ